MQLDGHMWGAEATPYLRAASRVRRYPHIYIYDGDYAVRNSAEDFNKGAEVALSVIGNIWDGGPTCEGVDQWDWEDKVRALCVASGLPIRGGV